MPNKTIYVSDGDLLLFGRAQELSGANLSATITTALKRFVEAEEGRREGYEEHTVRVGAGLGRKVRFTGVLLGEFGWSPSGALESYRVYRSRRGTFVVHTEQSAYGAFGDHGEKSLDLYASADELRGRLPTELYDLIAVALDQPPVEDLDI